MHAIRANKEVVSAGSALLELDINTLIVLGDAGDRIVEDVLDVLAGRFVEDSGEVGAENRNLVLPESGPEGWRAKLELIAREEWRLSCRHPWLCGAVSFTRPLLVPGMMAHTEWILRALDGLGLSVTTRFHEALTLHALVLNVAVPIADEAEAEQDTDVTLDRWRRGERRRTEELLNSGRFPLLAATPEFTLADLEEVFEYGLARHLDGLSALLGDHGSVAIDEKTAALSPQACGDKAS